MKLIANKIPTWIKETVEDDDCHIDCDKYFVMTDDTDEHVGFMKSREDQSGQQYFEIVIFDPEVEKELMLYRYSNGRGN